MSNPVAKHARRFNKAHVFKDKKKEAKKGKEKHKKPLHCRRGFFVEAIDYAIEKARSLPYVQGQRRVYALILDKKGNILSEGSNSYTKTHPRQAHYAAKVGKPSKVFLHAEMSAMVRVRNGEPYKIVIARVDHEGNPMLAAPCCICQEAIKASGIQVVEHTT